MKTFLFEAAPIVKIVTAKMSQDGGKVLWFRAVVVAQLFERSLPTPEISGSNPYISEILSTNWTIEKTKIKKKRP